MKKIELTQGKVAIVDDEDYEELSKYKWFFSSGYARRGLARQNGRPAAILLHVAIMGKMVGLEIDHVNGDRLDNRRENLRHVTRSQNNQNQAPGREGASSQHKGVSWYKRDKLWTAQIKADGKKCHLGRYESERDAAIAYNTAAIKHFGEYARINIIQEG